jgi:prevent-host-death family protein
MPTVPKSNPRVVSVLAARTNLDKILRRVRNENERFLIQQRGQPQAIVMSIEDYINLVAPSPDWLKESWKAAEEAGIDKMTMDEIDAIVADVRRERQARKDAAKSAQ